MNQYFELLKSWCDSLIRLQLTEIDDKTLYGGILCPACSIIHGRIGDAVYPFTLMYDKTGDEKYLNAAKKAVDWSEYNVLRKDGSYFNDRGNSWKGITVFSALAFGDTLLYHGKCLDRETYDKWKGIFVRFSEFIYNYFDSVSFRPNINYFASECPAMALAYLITGEEKYKVKAYEKAQTMRNFFTDDGLLFGEGHAEDVTPKKCVPVDLGYNVEESLPSLVIFAHLMKDGEYMSFCAQRFAAHIEFMLPDGAWDNSWGSRSNKWTYWGSRTSDGAQPGLCILAEYSDVFAEAAQRNFELLKSCTADGLLYGGKMYIDAGEQPCSHHTFCHAKALCAMIDSGFEYRKKTELPRDKDYGVKRFDSVHVSLIAKGGWRATVTDCDYSYTGATISGGTMTVLWHEKSGCVLAGAPSGAHFMTEPRNMQLSRHDDVIPSSALRITDGKHESINDLDAVVEISETQEEVCVNVKGTLKDHKFAGSNKFGMTYRFFDGMTEITFSAADDCPLIVPLVCGKHDRITLLKNGVEIDRNGVTVKLECNCNFTVPDELTFRNFAVIGGFETFPIEIKACKDCAPRVSISIEKR